ncbi:MAG: Z-ring associated protein ZapG [Arsenophonus sp. NEOnobi-MAG3]
MTWEYVLIALIVGFIIGVLLVRFGNTKLHNQQALQAKLEKKTHELEEYHKELISHFARSAELLDNMAQDYRQLYQHMPKSSLELRSDMQIQNNSFNYRLTELDNDQASVKLPPKDYSEGSSGLFRSI